MINFKLNSEANTKDEGRYWEFCVGSCHAATALREDYRNQLKECRHELGFKYLRFHGLFNDDMSSLTRSIFTGEYMISFTNIDNIFDFLLSIDMKPFIELGFMPECLKSGNETIFHYKANITPPSDEEVWIWFIKSFVNHLVDRYGLIEVRSWFFEVWNEPNLDGENGLAGGRFWSGNMDDYFRLYEITTLAIKSVDSRLKVGGPATSNNAFIPETIEFCNKNNLPLDFISTHHYPTDVVLGYGVEDSQNFVKEFNSTDREDKNTIRKLLKHYLTFQEDIWKKVDRGVLTDMAKRAKSESGNIPLYYTEWNSLAGIESDGEFGSSFIAKTIMDNLGLADCYAYWTFSDIFEEKSMPSSAFHGGFGLITLNGVKKASYRAYQLLHMLSGEKYQVNLTKGTVDVYAFRDRTKGTIQLLTVNHNSLLHDIEEETVTIELQSSAEYLHTADIYRVDEINSNALTCWKTMSMPEYLTKKQLLELKTASELIRDKIEVIKENDSAKIVFNMPKQAIALITLYEA